VIVQAGSGAAQNAAFEWNTYAGTDAWKWKMDTSNYLHLSDVVNSLDREVVYQNGNTILNAGAGANAVVVNNTSGSGTGGFIVYEGGTNNSTAAFTVGGTGNITALGTETNSGLATNTAGTGTIGTSTKWYNSLYLGTGTSYYVQLTPATPTASYTLTIPALTANDTIATLAGAQTFAGTKTFPSPTFTGTVAAAAITMTGTLQLNTNGAASSSPIKIAGTLYTGGSGTTTYPYFNFGATGSVTTWSTSGTWLGFNAASAFAGNFIDAHVNGGASVFNVTSTGFVNATGFGNISTLTVAAGAAAGSSPTIACATNVTCGWNGGTINLLTGTSPTTGALFTVTDTITHAKYPSCVYQIESASSSYVPNGTVVTTGFYPTNTSYTVETLNLSVALTASSYYQINYHCSGD
jgi:hypothetical protein